MLHKQNFSYKIYEFKSKFLKASSNQWNLRRIGNWDFQCFSQFYITLAHSLLSDIFKIYILDLYRWIEKAFKISVYTCNNDIVNHVTHRHIHIVYEEIWTNKDMFDHSKTNKNYYYCGIIRGRQILRYLPEHLTKRDNTLVWFIEKNRGSNTYP